MTPTQVARFWAKVDCTGECWVWTASTRANGYGQVSIDGRNRTAHRVAYELLYGEIPAGLLIDHVCRNRKCVNPAHLRVATTKQNLENVATHRPTRSGIRGVRWDKNRRKWHVAVTHNYRTINVGRFDSIEDAAAAATNARIQLFTHNEADRQGATS